MKIVIVSVATGGTTIAVAPPRSARIAVTMSHLTCLPDVVVGQAQVVEPRRHDARGRNVDVGEAFSPGLGHRRVLL